MLELEIPDFGTLRLAHLILDYNGTVAVDGHLLPTVREQLVSLASPLGIHVLTADTFGRAREELEGLDVELELLPAGGQAQAKRAAVERLGSDRCACIGNGRNDRLMLETAALGIAVLQAEGAAAAALASADVVCPDIASALALFTNPLRLTATLRS